MSKVKIATSEGPQGPLGTHLELVPEPTTVSKNKHQKGIPKSSARQCRFAYTTRKASVNLHQLITLAVRRTTDELISIPGEPQAPAIRNDFPNLDNQENSGIGAERKIWAVRRITDELILIFGEPQAQATRNYFSTHFQQGRS